MSNKMIEMCSCGQQFTVNGIDRAKYQKWKTFGDKSLSVSFPELSVQHHDQLIEGLCPDCMAKQWPDEL